MTRKLPHLPLLAALLLPTLAWAQTEDDLPPEADPNDQSWIYLNDIDGKFGGAFVTPTTDIIPLFPEFPPRQGLYTITKPSDVVLIRGLITDPDFLQQEEGGDGGEGGEGGEEQPPELQEEEIWIRVDVRVTQNFGTNVGLIGDGGWQRLNAQPTDPNFPFVPYTIRVPVPELLGPSLPRLINDGFGAGPDYDAVFRIIIQLANTEDPDPDEDPISLIFFGLVPDPNSTDVPPPLIPGRVLPEFAVRFDERNISNGPAFADAGVDQQVIPGAVVTLDASGTFDGVNAGFDPDAPLTFAEDRISYAWTWLDGPVRIDPVQVSDARPEATVTIPPVLFNTDPGGEDIYTFRVTTTDNVNTLSTSDTVQVRVSNFIENLRPRAEATIVTPGTEEVFLNEIVTISAATSADRNVPAYPNELTYFWTQVDELGAPITTADAEATFLPLNGVDTDTLTFQATRLGEFFFRVTVSDGALLDSQIVRIVVTDSAVLVDGKRFTMGQIIDSLNKTGSLPISPNQQAADEDTLDGGNAVAPGFNLCGGSLLPLMAVPLALCLLRRRSR